MVGLNSGGDASGLEMHQVCSLSRMVLTCIVSGMTLTRGGMGGGAMRSGRVWRVWKGVCVLKCGFHSVLNLAF